jgi:hypothetical protein
MPSMMAVVCMNKLAKLLCHATETADIHLKTHILMPAAINSW